MRGRHATSLRSNSNDIAVYSPRCAPAELRRKARSSRNWLRGFRLCALALISRATGTRTLRSGLSSLDGGEVGAGPHSVGRVVAVAVDAAPAARAGLSGCCQLPERA